VTHNSRLLVSKLGRRPRLGSHEWSRVFFLTEKSRDPGSVFLPLLTQNKNIPAPSQKAQNPAQAGCLCLFVTQVVQNWNRLYIELGAWYSFGRAVEAERRQYCH